VSHPGIPNYHAQGTAPVDRVEISKAPGQGLVRVVVEKVGQAIVTGEFGASDLTTESELAKRLGVSRNILREAVKILTAKGLLTARPGLGTSVEPERRWNLLDPDILRWMLGRALSDELIIAFTEVRLAAEATAAALAASQFDRRAYDNVSRALDNVKLAASGRGDLVAAEVAFHVAVLEASGNPFFLQLKMLVDTAVRALIKRTWSAGELASGLERYEQVVDAIFARDAAAAHEAMHASIGEVLTTLNALRDKAGAVQGWSSGDAVRRLENPAHEARADALSSRREPSPDRRREGSGRSR